LALLRASCVSEPERREVLKLEGILRTIALVTASLVALTGAADALTTANLTGSGDLTVSATGTIYFDAAGLDLREFVLTAASTITIDTSYPAGVPGVPDDTIGLLDVADTTRFSVVDDLFFDRFDYAGSLVLKAGAIHAIGPLVATESIVLNGGSLFVGSGIGGGPSTDPCSSGAGGITVTSGTVPSVGGTSAGCSAGIVQGPSVGTGFTPGLTTVIAQAVPEPTAGLLNGLGLATIVVVCRPR
jgi:hypothetical protein